MAMMLRSLSVAGMLALGFSAANAAVIDLTNAGNISPGVSLSGGTKATWVGLSTGAFSFTSDYLDFQLTADATAQTVRFNVVPNGLALPAGFSYEIGTAPGSSSVFGPSSTALVLPFNSGLFAGTEYFISFSSTAGGSFTAAVAQPGNIPTPGALVLFGSVFIGVSVLMRRRRNPPV